MNVFDELETQYIEIDDYYSMLQLRAVDRRWARAEIKCRRKRKINDQAYFLFMFSRLEDRIREESAKLIRKKHNSNMSWKKKAPWKILPHKPDDRRMHFMNRLALLTEKDAADYMLAKDYYKQRNSIAHGGDFIQPINMPDVIIELKRLYKALKA